jgi:hypothetical protein
MLSLVTGLIFLLLLLSQRWSPPLRLHVSDYSILRIMCDVPISAVFCSESVECFPGMPSKVFRKPFVPIQVAPVITGIIIHFMFHIRCICLHKLLYFGFFSASFCIAYSVHGYCHIYQYSCFHFLFVVVISGLFAVTYLSVCCVYCLIPGRCNIFLFIHWLGCVCVCVCVCVPFVCHFNVLICILSNANECRLYRFSLSTYSSPKWDILKLGGP